MKPQALNPEATQCAIYSQAGDCLDAGVGAAEHASLWQDLAQVCGPGLDLGLKPVSIWVLGKESAVTTGSVSMSRSDLHPGHGPLQCPGVSGTGFLSEPRVSI